MNQNRKLEWERCYNTRDLGGLPIAAGGTTRWRTVVRSDLLNRLTPAGFAALAGYGIRTIIDLRGPRETQAEPSPFAVPRLAGPVSYRNEPLEGYDPVVGALIDRAATRFEVYRLILDHYPERAAGVMRSILSAPPGGMVIHCHAGKDRTGIISALLLELTGVPRTSIADDYSQSQASLWPLYERLFAELDDTEEQKALVQPIAEAGTILETLAHLDRRYAGVEGYLSSAGLSAGEIQRLKTLLVDE